jgi:hypothetical protein
MSIIWCRYLVPAGGLSADGQQWLPAKHRQFLVPVKALGKIFRAKFRDALKKTPLYPKRLLKPGHRTGSSTVSRSAAARPP